MDRINELTKDCFNAVLHMRRTAQSALPPAELLHQRIRGFIDDLGRRAEQERFDREQAKDIAYAVVALADEVALSMSDAIRQYWVPHLLELHYFGSNTAGVSFFERLEEIRRDPHRAEVLRVYYLALALGFQGQHAGRSGQVELMNLLDGLRREVARGQPVESEELSPRGERPAEAHAVSHDSQRLLLISLAVAGAVVVIYLALLGWIDVSARTVAKDIRSITGS